MRAKEIGASHLSLTDHGTMAGHRDFQKACHEQGVVPILGNEVYFSPTDRFDKRTNASRKDGTSIYNHLTVLAQDGAGWQNLSALSEEAWKSGYYHKPRADLELFERYSEGLIVLSGCLNGPIAKAIERGDEESAIKWAQTFHELLGDRFLIEVQAHNPAKINHGLLAIADKLKIRPVMASDCHYAKPEDLWAEEAMLILSTSPDRLKEIDWSRTKTMDLLEKVNYLYPDRKMTFAEIKLHMRSLIEEQELFEASGITRKDIYENTNLVASMVGEYDYHSGLDLLPVPKYDSQERLESLVRGGAKRIFGKMPPEYQERLEEELGIIKDKSLARYFLVLHDLISWSKSEGILVGPGRGSGAGSLVNYCLGITSIDPIKYNLLFARFLDPERDDPADVDIDVPSTQRNKIKKYTERKFKHVAGINTFGMFKDKNLIKDACRVMCVPLAEVQQVVDSIETFEEFLSSKETAEFRKNNPDVVRIAKYLHGRIRQVGMHAGGLVVSNEPLSRYVPIETRKDPSSTTNDRIPVVALDMGEVESVGLIKIDLLGLKTLSVIQDTLDAVRDRHGVSIDLLGIDLEEEDVYAMLSEGHTVGVFQVEAAPYTKLVTDMGLDNFHDLVASNALVRPGAANTIGKTYIARKQGRDFAPKINPIYDSITSDTYGLVLYQEQVMLLCRDLAGLTWGEANKIRRIIGKKKDPHEFEQFRSKFVDGAAKQVGEAMASQLWSDFEAHASYSFNACLSGKTVVRRASSGRYCNDPNITVEDLYTNWHSKTSVGHKYRTKGVKIMALSGDGRVRPDRVVGVYQNGVKEIFRVTLENGATIDATANHRHLTDSGYVRVDELAVGDKLFYSDFQYEPTTKPGGRGRGWAKNSGRAIASDGRNRPSLGGYNAEYKANIKLLPMECKFCGSTDGRLEIAHLNSNNKDSRKENLARLCNSCHKKLDYSFGSRKKRFSKGYSCHELKIISIESVGYEMTYDIEMESDEHNFFANGIVTHNSHAVAYSTVSYWTAWLKKHYPLEFMFALLRNESSKQSRANYLLEAKRLGLDVFLPHVNDADVEVSITNDGLMFGLADVKYISEIGAKKIMQLRPFASYADLVEKAGQKGSGINKRAIQYLNMIGAAQFADNPLSGDERDNFYEVLGIPNFSAHDLPVQIGKQLHYIESFKERGTFVFYAIVTEIKKGSGWSRVTIMDSTGSAGVFHTDSSQIQKGKMYLLLVCDNSIIRYVPVDKLNESDNDPFLRYLDVNKLNIEPGKRAVIAFATRRTKSGQHMGTVVLAKANKEIEVAVVFPRIFAKALGRLKPGTVVEVRYNELDDGGLAVKEIL